MDSDLDPPGAPAGPHDRVRVHAGRAADTVARHLPPLRARDGEGRTPHPGAPLPARAAARGVRGPRGAARASGGRRDAADPRSHYRDEPRRGARRRRRAPARARARRDAVRGTGPPRGAEDHDPPRRRHPVSEELSARLRRVEQQVRAFTELHQSELQIILDGLTDIARQVDAKRAAAASPTQTSVVDPDDPAASSPKRAKWLSEQANKAAPKSRRELLFGERERET